MNSILSATGPERPLSEAWAREHDLNSRVTFHGWLPKSALAHFYTQAHFLLLPSASEGWPKVLSEAMAHGVVPLAGAVASIPQILSETGAGLALPPLKVSVFVEALVNLAESPGTSGSATARLAWPQPRNLLMTIICRA